MIVYCATNNRDERFRIKDVPITDYGVGWIGSNDAEMVYKFGKYLYKLRYDSSSGIMYNDINGWLYKYKESVVSLVGAGDTNKLSRYGKLKVNAVERYVEELSRITLYKAIHKIRIDLYNNNHTMWVSKVISEIKISGILLGSTNNLILFWDPSKISNYILVETNR